MSECDNKTAAVEFVLCLYWIFKKRVFSKSKKSEFASSFVFSRSFLLSRSKSTFEFHRSKHQDAKIPSRSSVAVTATNSASSLRCCCRDAADAAVALAADAAERKIVVEVAAWMSRRTKNAAPMGQIGMVRGSPRSATQRELRERT